MSSTNWKSISMGLNQGAAIDSNNYILIWGLNGNGQCGVGNVNIVSYPTQLGADTWSMVSAQSGSNNIAAIKSDGTLWATGNNTYGQLGTGNTTFYSSPIQIGAVTTWSKVYANNRATLLIKADGTMWSVGNNTSGQLGLNVSTANISTITQIGAATDWAKSGPYMSFYAHAIKTNGTLFGWGTNTSGQVGNGLKANLSSPVAIGAATGWTEVAGGATFTLGIESGKLYTWGANTYGQLGLNNKTSYSSPMQVGAETDWTKVAGMTYSSAGIRGGKLYVWGFNAQNILGTNTITNYSSPVQVGADTDWVEVVANTYAYMARKSNGKCYSVGFQQSVGDLTSISYKMGLEILKVRYTDYLTIDNNTYTDIACGTFHNLKLKNDGKIYFSGNNVSGQSGLGFADSTSLSNITISSPTQIGALNTWTVIDCAPLSCGGITNDGKCWVWGDNGNGLLGLGNDTSRSSPTQLGALTTWVDVIMGNCGQFTFFKKNDNTFWGSGLNTSGQLGQNNLINRSSPVEIGSGLSFSTISSFGFGGIAITTTGKLYSWGLNTYGTLGIGDVVNGSSPTQIGAGTTWSAIACGSFHAIALQSNGTLWAWGYNIYGQLGDDTAGTPDSPNGASKSVPIQIGADTDWEAIWAGPYCSFARKTDGSIWFWGEAPVLGGNGGIGSVENKSSPTMIGASNTNWTKIVAARQTSLYLVT